MASLIEELISILEEEQDIYESLFPITEKKTKVIIQNDLEALQNITFMEQEAIDRIYILEQKRAEVIVNVGIVLNQDPEGLSLKKIIKILEKQPEEQKKLCELHDNLKEIVKRLTQINSQNKSLIEESLEMIEFNMNFIQSTRMSQGNNYTKDASTLDIPTSQTGTFDARQ